MAPQVTRLPVRAAGVVENFFEELKAKAGPWTDQVGCDILKTRQGIPIAYRVLGIRMSRRRRI